MLIEFDKEKLLDTINNNAAKSKIKDFISDPNIQLLLNTNKVEELYNRYNTINRGNSYNELLTAVLLLADIDILRYTTEIPTFAFHKLPINKITIPKNIKFISSQAFEGAKVRRLYYEGTYDEFRDISKERFWRSDSQLREIVCSDGTFPINGNLKQYYKVSTFYNNYKRNARISPKGTVVLTIPTTGGTFSRYKGNPSQLLLFETPEQAQDFINIVTRDAFKDIEFKIEKFTGEYKVITRARFNGIIRLHKNKYEEKDLLNQVAYTYINY